MVFIYKLGFSANSPIDSPCFFIFCEKFTPMRYMLSTVSLAIIMLRSVRSARGCRGQETVKLLNDLNLLGKQQTKVNRKIIISSDDDDDR